MHEHEWLVYLEDCAINTAGVVIQENTELLNSKW